MTDFSTYLFATPSFSEGAGRLVDFGDTLTEYNVSISPQQADAIAMLMDFGAVGEDIKVAIVEEGADSL